MKSQNWFLISSVLSFIGFMTVVFGSGCTRPKLTAFGANQFKLPQQSRQLERFFTMQIFMIHFGSLIGRLIAPMLQEDVKCFVSDDCYPLAFGSAALAMFFGFFMLLSVRTQFVRKPPSGNMLIKLFKCVWVTRIALKWFSSLIEFPQDGLSEKFKNSKSVTKPHWLDYAEPKHGRKLVEETKTVLNVLVLYLPLPIYWAVYQLQGSRWTFQATLMNGDVGFYNIKPDQMIALSSIFGMIVIWLNDFLIYPLLARIRITTLLQKMLIGGLLAVVATMVAGFMETLIHGTNIHILWLVPQYLITSFSDNFLFNSHINFAYNEAPDSMKSVMTSFVFFVIAIGNIFVVTVSGTKLFQSQANEFFFFSGVLFLAMIWFGFLARRYQAYRKASITQIFDERDT